jgi:hypothetical protein
MSACPNPALSEKCRSLESTRHKSRAVAKIAHRYGDQPASHYCQAVRNPKTTTVPLQDSSELRNLRRLHD